MIPVLDKRPNPLYVKRGRVEGFGDFAWRLDTIPSHIYLAASLNAQREAAMFALQLQDAGFTVTSRWIRNDFDKKPSEPDGCASPSGLVKYQKWIEFEQNWGEQNLEDLEKADTLILLTDVPSSSGGLHVELGYFLGAGLTNIVAVGQKVPNVFFCTKNVRWVTSTNGLVEWLKSPLHGAYSPEAFEQTPAPGEYELELKQTDAGKAILQMLDPTEGEDFAF